jgi:hypothetical protein
MQSAFLLEQIAPSGSGIAIAKIGLFSPSSETSERMQDFVEYRTYANVIG